jgi:hypothetical protein
MCIRQLRSQLARKFGSDIESYIFQFILPTKNKCIDKHVIFTRYFHTDKRYLLSRLSAYNKSKIPTSQYYNIIHEFKYEYGLKWQVGFTRIVNYRKYWWEGGRDELFINVPPHKFNKIPIDRPYDKHKHLQRHINNFKRRTKLHISK